MFSIILTAGICIGMLRRMCLLHVQARVDARSRCGVIDRFSSFSTHAIHVLYVKQLEYLANALDAPIYQTKQVVSKGI